MSEPKKKQLRPIDAPFVALGPSGVAIRDRLKHLTTADEKVLRLVGEHLGHLASLDLKTRCADAGDHSADTWAARKKGLTADSSIHFRPRRHLMPAHDYRAEKTVRFASWEQITGVSGPSTMA